MEVIVALVSGLFGGIGGVVLWERWLRPGLDRKDVAAILASEIELNEERLLVTQMVRAQDRTRVLRHINLSTVAIDSYRHRLASFEPETLRLVMRFYWELDRAQTAANSGSDQWELYNQAEADTPERALRKRIIQEALESFDTCVGAALSASEQLRTRLYVLAKLKPSLRLSRSDLSDRAQASFNESPLLPPSET